jgi:predicted  nucleic acid-binding Zn-ribbon protein
MNETYQALMDLQELDERMAAAKAKVREFEPELEALEAPIVELEEQVGAVRRRLDEMKAEERRLERGADDKRAQLEQYEARLERVRNAREEAAARTEIDLISKAVEADEDDALSLIDQIRRAELKLDELEGKLSELRAEIEPQRDALLKERNEAADQLDILKDKRENKVVRLNDDAARLYERIRGGKTRVALARLMPDGACGHCFSMIPIQEQNEIRRREALHRCEACGVILFAED